MEREPTQHTQDGQMKTHRWSRSQAYHPQTRTPRRLRCRACPIHAQEHRKRVHPTVSGRGVVGRPVDDIGNGVGGSCRGRCHLVRDRPVLCGSTACVCSPATQSTVSSTQGARSNKRLTPCALGAALTSAITSASVGASTDVEAIALLSAPAVLAAVAWASGVSCEVAAAGAEAAGAVSAGVITTTNGTGRCSRTRASHKGIAKRWRGEREESQSRAHETNGRTQTCHWQGKQKLSEPPPRLYTTG